MFLPSHRLWFDPCLNLITTTIFKKQTYRHN